MREDRVGKLGAVVGRDLRDADVVVLKEVESFGQEFAGLARGILAVDLGVAQARVLVEGGVLVVLLAALRQAQSGEQRRTTKSGQILDSDLDIGAGPGLLIALVFAASAAAGRDVEGPGV